VLAFDVLVDGKPPADLDLDRMYLTSQEGQPIRARFRYDAALGRLFCERSGQGLAALNLLWTLRSGMRLMLRTALLQDANEPYLLALELARGRVADVWHKRDDWGYGFGGPTPGVEQEFQEVRLLLAKAQTVRPAARVAADLAEEALARSVALGETMAMEGARQSIAIRRREGDLPTVDFGCHWDSAGDAAEPRRRFGETFNYASIPFTWRAIEPREQEYQWDWHDACVDWLEGAGIVIKGGSPVRFTEAALPDWVWIWENDFETVRDLVFDHVERCVQRYRGRIDHWDTVTGLHVENCMNFPLDRIVELTRICARAVKRTDPSATAVLNLIYPWGEYYATNQRSVWPCHYAEMCMNANVDFDAVGIEFFFGAGGIGYAARDMLQISNQLDRFGALGKPVHVTACAVPSAVDPDPQAVVRDAEAGPEVAGVWRQPWDEVVQSDWLDAFYRVAISKPFVRSISWRDFTDEGPHYFPHGGLLRADGKPKIAYQRLAALRREIWPGGGRVGDGNANVVWPE